MAHNYMYVCVRDGSIYQNCRDNRRCRYYRYNHMTTTGCRPSVRTLRYSDHIGFENTFTSQMISLLYIA